MEATEKAFLDERRAAALIGVSPADVLLLTRQAGLGRRQTDNGAAYTEHVELTYDELRQLSLMTGRPHDYR